jgi:hypothetical protein
MSYARTNDSWLDHDPELKESLRVIRRQHSVRLIGVVVALCAAVAITAAYASLSYGDRNESTPVQHY